MHADPSGCFVITTAIIIGLITGAVIGATVGGVIAYNYATAAGMTGWDLVGQVVLGALGGGFAGAAIGAVVGAGAWLLATGLAAGIGALGTAISALPGGILMGSLATGGAVVVADGTVAVAGVLGVAAVLGLMFSKPNSGRIRFSDGTGIDPETGNYFKKPEDAREYYKTLKDPQEKLRWKKWLKGKGWYPSHLK